jgi:ATP-dependent Clp protease ATP-binding subunit ClpC
MKGPFTERARQAIKNAEDAAVQFGHTYVGTEHLLLGLARVEDGVASKALEMQAASAQEIEKQIEEQVGNQNAQGMKPQDFTPRTKRIFEMSYQEAARMGHNYVGTEHVLIALMRENE